MTVGQDPGVIDLTSKITKVFIVKGKTHVQSSYRKSKKQQKPVFKGRSLSWNLSHHCDKRCKLRCRKDATTQEGSSIKNLGNLKPKLCERFYATSI